MHPHVSPRRPPLRHPHQRSSPRRNGHLYILACTPTPLPPKTLKRRLEELLDSIPTFLDRTVSTVESSASSIPEHVRNLFAPGGALSALIFWRDNSENLRSTGKTLLNSGEALVKGDTESFRERASGLDFSWLRQKRRESENAGEAQAPSLPGGDDALEKRVRSAAVFVLESLTPWDFDRHDFGLTFANVWYDVDISQRESDPMAIVKMTSTIKPLEQEWKVSARTKFLDLGEDACIFGKTGIYLAGDKPAYIGLEADRVFPLPNLKDTKLFVNVNYNSSRKPDADPVKSSFGLQQDFQIAKGFELTLRVGINPVTKEKWYVSPVPYGSYF